MFNPVATPLLLLLVAGPTVASDNRRAVGVAVCAGCHATQANAWSAGAHAAALRGLPAARRSDAKCVGCHTTGLSTLLQGVQCESCHGPADTHATNPRGQAVGRKGRPFMTVADAVCFRCHTADAPRRLELPVDRRRIHPAGLTKAGAAKPPGERPPSDEPVR